MSSSILSVCALSIGAILNTLSVGAVPLVRFRFFLSVCASILVHSWVLWINYSMYMYQYQDTILKLFSSIIIFFSSSKLGGSGLGREALVVSTSNTTVTRFSTTWFSNVLDWCQSSSGYPFWCSSKVCKIFYVLHLYKIKKYICLIWFIWFTERKYLLRNITYKYVLKYWNNLLK